MEQSTNSSSSVTTPLVYSELSGVDLSVYTNLLLIDSTVRDYHNFVTSVKSDTFPVVYSWNSSRDDLLALVSTSGFSNLSRIGLVFETNDDGQFKPFLNTEALFTESDSENVTPFSPNMNFLINLIQTLGILNIDYLACDTLNFNNWVKYYAILMEKTNVIVGASNDKTGNIKYGGDWVLESTGEDIENIYFTSNIGYHTYLLAISNHSMVIINGVVYGCGANANGQLGIGSTASPKTSLVAMINNTGKTPSSISSGNVHTLILMTDGTVYGTGINWTGNLGTGNTTQQTSITATTMPSGKTAKMVSCGQNFSTVLMTDGTIYATGQNSDGQLGLNNTTTPVLTLTQMINNTGKTPTMISCGSAYTMVLMTDGTIYGTGSNSFGQLGINNSISVNILTQLINNTGKTPKIISSGSSHFVVLMMDGTLYGTGSNGNGELGLSNTVSSKTTLTLIPNNTGKTFTNISSGSSHTIVLMSDGTVYGTGLNTSGQLGLTNVVSPVTSLTPMTLPTGKTASRITATGQNNTILLMTDGTVYGTGYNASGHLGINNTTSPITSLTQMTTNSGSSFATNVSYIYGSIIVVQAQPTSNVLTTLVLNNKTITFSGYSAVLDVSNGVSSISGTYTLQDPTAKFDLSVNTVSFPNIASPFTVSNLLTGDNSLNFLVKASDGLSQQAYSVKVHVQTSNVLTTLVLNNKTITFSGYSAVLDVSNGVSSISGTYTLQDPTAKFDLSVNTVSFPNIASPFTVSNLLTGDNSLNFLVKASDGLSQQAYSVKVDVAELSSFQSLSLNGQTITFTNYAATIQIPYYIYDLSGTYTVSDINSSIDLSVNSTFYSSISSNFNFQLNQQNNVLTFLIKASDGFSSQIYNVNILKSSSKVSCVLEGTFVWTDKGYVPIETIREGDSIRTDNYFITVTKVGKWSVDLNKEEDRNDLSKKMHKISAGTYGAERDTYISHYHRVLVDETPESEQETRVFRLPTSLGLPVADPSEYSKNGKYTLYHLELAIGNHYVVNGCCKVESWKTNMKYF